MTSRASANDCDELLASKIVWLDAFITNVEGQSISVINTDNNEVIETIAIKGSLVGIAIGWGAADPSFRSPMATAVIGGLVTSTFLSLLVIPVVFTYVDDAARFFAKWVLRRPE